MKIIDALKEIKDERKYNGKEYQLWQIILFSILAIASNAKTYIDIQRFIEHNFEDLRTIFKLRWRRFPTHSCIWKILTRVEFSEMERVFCKYFAGRSNQIQEGHHICFDGKVLCGSESKTQDERAVRIFNAFSSVSENVLAHMQLESEKDSEIPAFQEFLQKLNLKGTVVSVDAMHCQKKPLMPLKTQGQS